MESLITARKNVQAQGIQSFYKLYSVGTPKEVMLQVIFNITWSQAWKNANPEEKESLRTQRAIFELACEEQIKNPSTYSTH